MSSDTSSCPKITIYSTSVEDMIQETRFIQKILTTYKLKIVKRKMVIVLLFLQQHQVVMKSTNDIQLFL